MTRITYDIVEHDGGFAYKVGDVFSETFPTHKAAHEAAAHAAQRQQVSGTSTGIEYETRDGVWHQEVAEGEDRPEAVVEDNLKD